MSIRPIRPIRPTATSVAAVAAGPARTGAGTEASSRAAWPVRLGGPAGPACPRGDRGPVGGGAYEVTLVGELAPALVHALGPGVRATRRDECVLVAGAPATRGEGLVRLLRALAARGCEVWQVTARAAGRDSVSPQGPIPRARISRDPPSRDPCERHQPAQQGGDHQDAAEEDQP